MFSKSHQEMPGISAGQLLDLKQWQKIQDLFSEIVDANIWLVEPSGLSLTDPSKVHPFCSDFTPSEKSPKINRPNCVLKAFQNWAQNKQDSYCCPHRLHYFALPIGLKDGKTLGVITVGPLLVGKREDEKAYRKVCDQEKLDSKSFLDQVLEMRVFSYMGIRIVMDFLQELVQYLVRLAYQKDELERLVPGFLALRKGEGVFSVTYSKLLSNYLLDIASEVVGADSGSVLLVDAGEEGFFIKSARGIRSDVLKRGHIPLRSGVAGWVVRRRKPVLIAPGSPGMVPKEKLRRPQIKCSMVVPLEFGKKVLGVFCLNSKSANKRFNQENLVLLDQLGKLASVALSRVSAN